MISIANQKGGVGKTTTALNLGVGLANTGKKVLMIDLDPQSDLTVSMGWKDSDKLEHTISEAMMAVIKDQPVQYDDFILHHNEGVDLIPSNISLASLN